MLANNPLGDRLRLWLGYHPPLSMRPWGRHGSVSDLFVWRAASDWQTRFEILNIPSLSFPAEASDDPVRIVIYDANGRQLAEIGHTVGPFRRKSIELSEICRSLGEYGTFACFHLGRSKDQFETCGGHLSDRGYVGYKRKSHSVWAYAHGNLQAVAGAEQGQASAVGTWGWSREIYRPQLTFDDCPSFELVFTNPTMIHHTVDVRYLDRERRLIRVQTVRIPPRGVRLFSYENSQRPCVTVESISRIKMERPLVFKHYGTHFNVLHS